MAAKQKMIADELGLSVMTVSRALRNHPDVSEETKQKVIQKALELNYNKTPALGRSEMSMKRIAVLIYESASMKGSNHPSSIVEGEGIYQTIFRTVQAVCRKKHVETVVELPPWEEVPIAIQNRGVNGAIILGRYTKDLAAKFGSIPAISVSSFREEAVLPQVVAKNSQGMRIMVEHLIQLGHKKIVFYMVDDSYTEMYLERSRGYIAAMVEHGLTPVIKKLPNPTYSEISAPMVDDIANYTAAACANDVMALAVKNLLEARGMKCPQDLSIVGFDNEESRFANWLTSYSPRWDEMGRVAVNMLLACPQDLVSPLQISVSGELVQRSSTASPRAGA